MYSLSIGLERRHCQVKRGKKKKKNCTGCEMCSHCIPIGEGDHICDAQDVPRVIIEEYAPADGYLWCHGKYFD